MGVNFLQICQNYVISKCGKSQNKDEVAEEIGYGNEFKSVQKIGGKNSMIFKKKHII